MRTFFDSSAWAKRYVQEEHSTTVMHLCKVATEIVLSILTPIEILSALNRLRRDASLSQEQYLKSKALVISDCNHLATVGINSAVQAEAVIRMEKSPLKASDAIQVASAIVCQCDLLVSFDSQMQKAARMAGLKTLILTDLEK